MKEIKDVSEIISKIIIDDVYGEHEILYGHYFNEDNIILQTQAKFNGLDQPYIDIIINKDKIKIDNNEDFYKEWCVPKYLEEIYQIIDEINISLEEYYNQFEKQIKYIKRKSIK